MTNFVYVKNEKGFSLYQLVSNFIDLEGKEREILVEMDRFMNMNGREIKEFYKQLMESENNNDAELQSTVDALNENERYDLGMLRDKGNQRKYQIRCLKHYAHIPDKILNEYKKALNLKKISKEELKKYEIVEVNKKISMNSLVTSHSIGG